MVFFYFVILVTLAFFYVGFLFLIGKRIVISTKKDTILRNLFFLGGIFALYTDRGFEYNQIEGFYDVIFPGILFFIPIFLYLLFFLFFPSNRYALYNNKKEDIGVILKDFLNSKGVPFKIEGDFLLLGETYSDRIKYTNYQIDFSECSNLELRNLIVQQLKINGKYSSKNTKWGIIIIFCGIFYMFLSWKLFGKNWPF